MDNDLETTEKAFDEIPEEVKEYIYSDDFDKSLELLYTEIGLSEANKVLLKASIFEFIAQIDDEDNLLNTINEITLSDVTRIKIKDWIAVNVYQKILSIITDAYVNEEDDEEDASTAIRPTITKDPLSSLSDRLKQASIATPAKRDYSLNRPTAGSSSDPLTESPSSTPRTIDPYHEPVDNE